MGILITKSGLLDTVQDQGRFGYSQWGVNAGGAADPFASRLANIILGNCPEEPLLELHFPALQAVFTESCWVAITGADFAPTLNGLELPMNRPVKVLSNDRMVFTKFKSGARAYLAVQGGLDLPLWLGSASANLKLPELGILGRKLKEGDLFAFKLSLSDGKVPAAMDKNNFFPDIRGIYEDHEVLDVLPGREFSMLTLEAQQLLENQVYRVLPQSDRMGYRLFAEPLMVAECKEMVSTGVRRGTVQRLPNGQLIVLTADHQTTGGYPRLLEVVSASYPKLAQLKQGDLFRFRFTDLPTAEEVYFKQRELLEKLRWVYYYKWH